MIAIKTARRYQLLKLYQAQIVRLNAGRSRAPGKAEEKLLMDAEKLFIFATETMRYVTDLTFFHYDPAVRRFAQTTLQEYDAGRWSADGEGSASQGHDGSAQAGVEFVAAGRSNTIGVEPAPGATRLAVPPGKTASPPARRRPANRPRPRS